MAARCGAIIGTGNPTKMQKINPLFLDGRGHRIELEREAWLTQAILVSAMLLFALAAFAYEVKHPPSDVVSVPSARHATPGD